MSEAFLLLVIAWVIFSTNRDGRETNKQKILAEMKDTYSKREALEIAYQMKHNTIIIYLAYGFLIGIGAAAVFIRF